MCHHLLPSTQMLLVTGGFGGSSHHDGSSHLSTTELISLTSPTAWTRAASLPQAISYLSVSLSAHLSLTSWTRVRSLPQAMTHHSVASLPGPAGGLFSVGGISGGYRDWVRAHLTPVCQ